MNRLALLIGLCLFVTACNKRGDGDQSKLAPADSPAPNVPLVGAPITDEEARNFAESLERAVVERDGKSISDLLRNVEFSKRMISDLGLPEEDMRIMMRDVEVIAKSDNPLRSVCKVLDDGGSFKLLRVRTIGERKTALFRLIIDDAAFNYIEVHLARFPDGAVGMEDFYNFFTGEMLSQTVRRIMIPIERARFVRPVSEMDRLLIDNLPTVRQMIKALSARSFDECIKDYSALPQALRENKSLFLMYLRATAELGDDGRDAWLKGVERIRQVYPEDRSIDLLSIDYFVSKKQFDEALKSVARVEKAVGGDARLVVKRAEIQRLAGRYMESLGLIREAIQQEPTLEEAYWSAIDLSLAEKKNADTLSWLKQIVLTFDNEVEDLEKNEQYADFVKSPQYREWQGWYRANKKK